MLKNLHSNYIFSFEINPLTINCPTSCILINITFSKESNYDKDRIFSLWTALDLQQEVVNLSTGGLIFQIKPSFLRTVLSIEVSHLHVNKLYYNHTIKMNGRTVYSTIDDNSRTFENVTVYSQFAGLIKSLNITSKGKGKKVFVHL